MGVKKKLLGKCISYIKKKKISRPSAVLLLIFCLIIAYALELVCLRKKTIMSAILVAVLAILSLTYFFYDRQTNQVFADTISQTATEIKETRSTQESYREDYVDSPQIQTFQENPALSAEPNTFIEGKKPYYIKVNRKQNCVTVYTYDYEGNYTVPVKAMVCSTGGNKTPAGTFKISTRYEFRNLLFDVYGQYAVRIVGQILFHSSSYSESEKDTLIAEEYNRLGEGISHGCIRLAAIDAKWIFDNCESGTAVEIYDDDDPGPLGKPLSITVPEGTIWDPTDPDPENPWKDVWPKLEGVVNKTLKKGTRVDLYEGIKAYDTCGNDITSQVAVSGAVNIHKAGSYTVSYYVKDLLGKTVSVTSTYTVVE